MHCYSRAIYYYRYIVTLLHYSVYSRDALLLQSYVLSQIHCYTVVYIVTLLHYKFNVATRPDDPGPLGQMGDILTGSLGYLDITKITGFIRK